MAAGMDDMLSKPIDQDKFFRVIARWAGPRSAEAGDEVAAPAPVAPAATPPAPALPPPAAGPGLPHFDREVALSRVNGNLELLKRFIRLFIERNGNAAAEIARAVEAGDLEAAKRTAHTLKGSAGTVGLVVVQQIAGRLEGLLLQQIATPDDVFQDHYRALAAELAEAWQRGLDTISTIS